MGINYERMDGDERSFDSGRSSESFEDPFANTGSSPNYDNLPVDYAAENPSASATTTMSMGAPAAMSRGTSGLDLAQAIGAGSMAMPRAAPRQNLLTHERRSLWGQCSYNIGEWRRHASRKKR